MKDTDTLTVSAQVLPQLDNLDHAVACLRERVLNFEDDPRDLVATLLDENRPLIAARLVASLRDLNIPEDHLKAGHSTVKVFCKDQLACSTASDDPIRFTDLVEALAALEPANVNVAKFVERGCILLLNQARRSLAEGDKRDATALARRAAAAKLTGQAIRIRCADVLADCGRPDEGAVVLLDSHEYDDKLLGRVAALLRSVDDWSGLYVRFESLRQLPECEEILVDVRNRISVQLNESLDSKDVLHLLNGALALVAASRPFAIDSDLAAAILKRSRRAIRQLGRGNHPLVGELCSKHLALCPEDRDVRRRYVRLLMACGRHSEARDELLHQMRRDPHDEAMWRDLSKCCAILGLRREASDAETRAHSMADSGTFDVVELRS